MSSVSAPVRDGDEWRGGVIGYPLPQLYGEVAYIAYHFHWPHDQVMTMEHVDRRRWIAEISSINERMNEE